MGEFFSETQRLRDAIEQKQIYNTLSET